MRRTHLPILKKIFRVVRHPPVKNSPADLTSAIAQLQQNQALIIDAINALNTNLNLAVLFANNAATIAATTESISDIEGDLFSLFAGWVQPPSEI